jgi:hypothetical protein
MKPFSFPYTQGPMIGFDADKVSRAARRVAQAMWTESLSDITRIYVGCQYGALSHPQILKASAYLISLHSNPPDFPCREEIMRSISSEVRCETTKPLLALRHHYENIAAQVRDIECAFECATEDTPRIDYPEGYLELTAESHYLHAIERAATLLELTCDPCMRLLAVYAETMSAESVVYYKGGQGSTPVTPRFAGWLKENIKVIYEGFITEG